MIFLDKKQRKMSEDLCLARDTMSLNMAFKFEVTIKSYSQVLDYSSS